jgi:hypothetical protein
MLEKRNEVIDNAHMSKEIGNIAYAIKEIA